MALTPTKQIPLGFTAPAFSLPDTVSGKTLSLEELKSDKATVVLFICNHCPYVKHINEALVAVANKYIPKGVSFIAISSNDVAVYPDDSPEQMKIEAERLGYPFAYLYDETQEVARAYTAECTPDLNVFDGNMRCVYRGQFDGSRPGSNIPVTGEGLARALDTMLAGNKVSEDQTPSVGCGIKWKTH